MHAKPNLDLFDGVNAIWWASHPEGKRDSEFGFSCLVCWFSEELLKYDRKGLRRGVRFQLMYRRISGVLQTHLGAEAVTFRPF